MEEILYEKDGAIATITLNRPDRLNAISTTMLSALSKRLLEANDDVEVRAIVITGAGRGFCSGLDLVDARPADPASAAAVRASPPPSTCGTRRRRCSTRSTRRRSAR